MHEKRKALPIHHTDTSDASWDGPANKTRLKSDGDQKYYRQAFAWQDMEKDSSTKAAYKFVHHEVDSNGDVGAANLTACSAGIVVLNGARKGTTIPDSDRQGVYRHLAAHLEDGDQEPPELKSIEPPKRDKSGKSDDMEIRYMPVTEFRVDQEDDDELPVIRGYAARFNEWSEPIWFFREKIKKGAFKKTIKEQDQRALWNHESKYVLGRRGSGTLNLWEDNDGLQVEITPPNAQWAKDLTESIKRGDVDGMSIGFNVIKDEWKHAESEKDLDERTILETRLIEVSVVTFPAYPTTSAYVRSLMPQGVQDIADFDSIAKVIFRKSKGIELVESDYDQVRSFVSMLQSFLPAEENPIQEPEHDHSQDDEARASEPEVEQDNHSETDDQRSDEPSGEDHSTDDFEWLGQLARSRELEFEISTGELLQ